MILRARLKPIEEIPPEAICCEARRESLQRNTGTIVRIDTDASTEAHCGNCGEAKGAGLSVVGQDTAIDPRMWDIEEAPEERMA